MREWSRKIKRGLVLALSAVLNGNSIDLSGLSVSATESLIQESVSGGKYLREISHPCRM